MALIAGLPIPLHFPVQSMTGSGAIHNYLGYVDANPSGPATYTLPPGLIIVDGALVIIRNKSQYGITVNCSPGNSIDGASSTQIAAFQTLPIILRAANNWSTMSNF